MRWLRALNLDDVDRKELWNMFFAIAFFIIVMMLCIWPFAHWIADDNYKADVLKVCREMGHRNGHIVCIDRR